METASSPTPLCIWTYVTARGQRCFYVGLAEHFPDGAPRPLHVPDEVRVQIHALGARRAWVYTGAPYDICAADEASRFCAPVTAAPISAVGRLVFG